MPRSARVDSSLFLLANLRHLRPQFSAVLAERRDECALCQPKILPCYERLAHARTRHIATQCGCRRHALAAVVSPSPLLEL